MKSVIRQNFISYRQEIRSSFPLTNARTVDYNVCRRFAPVERQGRRPWRAEQDGNDDAVIPSLDYLQSHVYFMSDTREKAQSREVIENKRPEKRMWGIHLTQVTPISCGLAGTVPMIEA